MVLNIAIQESQHDPAHTCRDIRNVTMIQFSRKLFSVGFILVQGVTSGKKKVFRDQENPIDL